MRKMAGGRRCLWGGEVSSVAQPLGGGLVAACGQVAAHESEHAGAFAAPEVMPGPGQPVAVHVHGEAASASPAQLAAVAAGAGVAEQLERRRLEGVRPNSF